MKKFPPDFRVEAAGKLWELAQIFVSLESDVHPGPLNPGSLDSNARELELLKAVCLSGPEAKAIEVFFRP